MPLISPRGTGFHPRCRGQWQRFSPQHVIFATQKSNKCNKNTLFVAFLQQKVRGHELAADPGIK
jgi:hypothetical protein